MGSPFPLLLAIARRHRPGGTASPLGRRQSPFLNLITLCHGMPHHRTSPRKQNSLAKS
jgi:hypothetical protein